jgi:hypothetical protein
MPDVRQQIAISDGAVKRRLASVQRFGAVVDSWRRVRPDDRGGAVSGAPDSVRPADLLGPTTASCRRGLRRPIAGAPWRRRGRSSAASACARPPGAHEFVTETGATAAYVVPSSTISRGASARVRRFTLIVYHRGHVAWRSDRLFPGREARRDFSQRGSRVASNAGSRRCATPSIVASWAAARRCARRRVGAAGRALELEGQPSRAPAAARPPRRASPRPAPLDISKLLSDDEIRGVTGFVGKFEDGS